MSTAHIENSTATPKPPAVGVPPPASGSRPSKWKPMDVVYGPYIQSPRRLIVEVYHRGDEVRYETISEGEGVGGDSENSLWATAEEWLEWLTKFQDEMTGRDYREAQERVRRPLVEPKSWADFRKRYAETGCPWL